MEGKKLTMILSDGTKLTDLSLNGNNYISSKKVTAADFKGKLQKVMVTDGKEQETYNNCRLVQITQVGKDYWFIINEMTQQELFMLQTQANTDYIAAMTDIEL